MVEIRQEDVAEETEPQPQQVDVDAQAQAQVVQVAANGRNQNGNGTLSSNEEVNLLISLFEFSALLLNF